MSLLHVIKNRLWQLRLRLLGDVRASVKQLVGWEALDEKELRRKRNERLRSLLRHAGTHTTFYGDRLRRHGVISGDTVRLGQFENIPLLNKETLRTQSEALRSDDLNERDWWYNTSGGSTGEPVQFVQDQEYQQWALAVKKHFNDWTGYQVGQPRVKLWGSERDLLAGEKTLKTKVRRWVRNEYSLNAFRMGKAQMPQFVEKINDVKPVQILAYVESIYELAQFIEEEGLKVHSPRAVLSTAGTLHDHMRNTIQRVFEAPVFNRYGSREVGDIACECEEHEGLHVSAPTHYVEILRPDGTPTEPGEVGEIVVTLLTNYAMPLIRYRIGDMGAWAEGECSCGRPWPLLSEVTGRVSDTFVTDDGGRIHGEFFTHLFYGEEWVQKFQVVQESVQTITIAVVPSDLRVDPDRRYQSEMNAIREDIRSVMGETCDIMFDFREEIPPTDSGKYRYTISRVDRERVDTDR